MLADHLSMPCSLKYRKKQETSVVDKKKMILHGLTAKQKWQGLRRWYRRCTKRNKLKQRSRTLVLVGRTRNGKSATGNSILGGKIFMTRVGSSSVTSTTERKSTRYGNRAINVIDTPGLPDDDAGLEATRQEIVKLAGEGIHAVLLVFSVKTRFSKEEELILETLKLMFGPKITDYIIIVFTGGDELEENEETIEEYLGPECPEHLQRILEAVERRYVLFYNKTKDGRKKTEQLEALLELVEKVVEANAGRPFIHGIFPKAQNANNVRRQQGQIDSSQGHTKAEPTNLKMRKQESHDKQRKQSTETEANKVRRQLGQTNSSQGHTKVEPTNLNMQKQELHDKQGKQSTKTIDKSYRSRDRHLTISEDTPTRTLVLVGRARNGKSATGNSILEGKYFTTRVGSSSVTTTTEMKSTKYGNRNINVIDTPGLPDDDAGLEATNQEIVNCVNLASDEIHAVLLVFSVKNRFSKEDELILESLKSLFGPKIIDYIIIVFTGGDELEENEETIDEYLGPECPLQLQRILEACKRRYVLLDNKTEDERKKEEQRQAVIKLVDKVVEANDGRPFISDYFLKAKEATKVRRQQEQIDSSRGYTKEEPADVKKQTQELQEKQYKQSTETLNQIERQRLRSLEQRLAEKLAAQKKLEEEKCRNKEDIERLEREIEKLRRQSPRTGHCISL